MAKHMLVNEGLELLNKFLSSNNDRLGYANRAREQYDKYTTFGRCPYGAFKLISNGIDKLIRKAKS